MQTDPTKQIKLVETVYQTPAKRYCCLKIFTNMAVLDLSIGVTRQKVGASMNAERDGS